MELWGWLIGYVVLFALLHLVLYYYYLRRDGEEASSAPSLTDGNYANARYGAAPDRFPEAVDEPDHADVDRDEFDHDVDGETTDCVHCGAPNDADSVYTYCWHCTSTLRQ